MKFLFFLLLMLLTQQVLGQAPKIEISESYDAIKCIGKYVLTKENDNKVLSVKFNEEITYLQLFDVASMKELNRIEYKDEKILERPKIKTVKWFGGRAYIFYVIRNEKGFDLYTREIDFEKGTFASKTAVKVSSVEGDIRSFSLNFSSDRSKCLASYKYAPKEIDDDINYAVYGNLIFDKDFTVLSKNDLKMPFTEVNIRIVDYELASDGTIYYLSKRKKEDAPEGKERKTRSSHNLELFKLPLGATSLSSIITIKKNEFFHQQRIRLLEGDEKGVVIAGLYNKRRISNICGIFAYKINETGKLIYGKRYDLPVDLFEEPPKQPKKKKQIFELGGYYIDDVIVQDDGSILLIAEKSYSAGSSVSISYHENILVAKIGIKGGLSWLKNLPKGQSTSSSYVRLGFKYVKINNIHHFVYIDHPKNMNLSNYDRIRSYVDGYLINGDLISNGIQDDSGESKKTLIANLKDVQGYALNKLYTGAITELGDGKLGLEFSKKKKEDVMVVVELK